METPVLGVICHKPQTTRKEIMKSKVVIMFGFLALSGLMSSCGDSKKYQITNTQDWVDFVSSASDVKEIDKCFMSMSPRQIINIYEEMVPAIVHITTQEFDAKSKCRAFMWLYCGIIAHSDRFTPEQYSQIENRDSNEDIAWRICFTCIGSEADEISKEYGGYLHGK